MRATARVVVRHISLPFALLTHRTDRVFVVASGGSSGKEAKRKKVHSEKQRPAVPVSTNCFATSPGVAVLIVSVCVVVLHCSLAIGLSRTSKRRATGRLAILTRALSCCFARIAPKSDSVLIILRVCRWKNIDVSFQEGLLRCRHTGWRACRASMAQGLLAF